MYGCESWTIKKAERQRTDAFEVWYWRLWRVPWITRRPDQSILKEINPEYSSEGLMLKLKLRCFGHLMWSTNLLEKTLMLGNIEGQRRRGQQRLRWLGRVTNSMDSMDTRSEQTPGNSDRQGSLACCSPWGCKELDTTQWLNNSSVSLSKS